MQTVTVLRAFDEYEGKKLVPHRKGDEITATNERAEQLRAAGLVRSKPQPKAEPAPAAHPVPDKAD